MRLIVVLFRNQKLPFPSLSYPGKVKIKIKIIIMLKNKITLGWNSL